MERLEHTAESSSSTVHSNKTRLSSSRHPSFLHINTVSSTGSVWPGVPTPHTSNTPRCKWRGRDTLNTGVRRRTRDTHTVERTPSSSLKSRSPDYSISSRVSVTQRCSGSLESRVRGNLLERLDWCSHVVSPRAGGAGGDTVVTGREVDTYFHTVFDMCDSSNSGRVRARELLQCLARYIHTYIGTHTLLLRLLLHRARLVIVDLYMGSLTDIFSVTNI